MTSYRGQKCFCFYLCDYCRVISFCKAKLINFWFKSVTFRLNRTGLFMDPCGTPNLVNNKSEFYRPPEQFDDECRDILKAF